MSCSHLDLEQLISSCLYQLVTFHWNWKSYFSTRCQAWKKWHWWADNHRLQIGINKILKHYHETNWISCVASILDSRYKLETFNLKDWSCDLKAKTEKKFRKIQREKYWKSHNMEKVPEKATGKFVLMHNQKLWNTSLRYTYAFTTNINWIEITKERAVHSYVVNILKTSLWIIDDYNSSLYFAMCKKKKNSINSKNGVYENVCRGGNMESPKWGNMDTLDGKIWTLSIFTLLGSGRM